MISTVVNADERGLVIGGQEWFHLPLCFHFGHILITVITKRYELASKNYIYWHWMVTPIYSCHFVQMVISMITEYVAGKGPRLWCFVARQLWFVKFLLHTQKKKKKKSVIALFRQTTVHVCRSTILIQPFVDLSITVFIKFILSPFTIWKQASGVCLDLMCWVGNVLGHSQ